MTDLQEIECGLHTADVAALAWAVEQLRGHHTDTALAGLLPALSAARRTALAAHCSLAHIAVMVFPRSLAELRGTLARWGLTAGEPSPSTVVRQRLARRHGVAPALLDVVILRAAVPGAGGGRRELEIFALTVGAGPLHETIAAQERADREESHVAFEAGNADEVVLAGIRALVTATGGMRADGGGCNPHEDTTVLYFRTHPDETDAGGPPGSLGHRLEISTQGHHPDTLAAHAELPGPAGGPAAPEDSAQPARHLLELMTGAWATQAIAVAAELRLADHLPAVSSPQAAPAVAELAERAGAHPDALRRLLRYLAALGLMEGDGESFRLTGTGRLLRERADGSLRPLALLYGGPFYRSFGELAHAVRTGDDGFASLHGRGHFDHFAEHPDLADLFDRAMAASAAMFDPVPRLLELSGAGVVVDVAGGNGELLARVLRGHPHLRGVLFERAHVVEAARGRLREAGCADRCTLVVGDFTKAVPRGGDVYLLSRVLHDWNDERCRAILRRCAEAMAEGAELALVERLLPEDGRPSLAPAWDVHMLCNVGGRERTAKHYARLLATAGFTLDTVEPLCLDGFLLRARRTAAHPARTSE
ncbi:methyltransferase [Streptomyces sp. NPDC005336]|uniref:methyltransferase n=1 Tax=unclassified Streptomyces TaxID=2593676 RepID=UPI0033BF88B3